MSKKINNVPTQLQYRLELHEIFKTESPMNVINRFIHDHDIDVVRSAFARGSPCPDSGTFCDGNAAVDLLRDVRYNYALSLVYEAKQLHDDQGKALKEARRLAGTAMNDVEYLEFRG